MRRTADQGFEETHRSSPVANPTAHIEITLSPGSTRPTSGAATRKARRTKVGTRRGASFRVGSHRPQMHFLLLQTTSTAVQTAGPTSSSRRVSAVASTLRTWNRVQGQISLSLTIASIGPGQYEVWIQIPASECPVACPGVMDPFLSFDKERRRLQEKGSHWHASLWCIRLDLVGLSTPMGLLRVCAEGVGKALLPL